MTKLHNKKKIYLAAGGTGGHLSPAIALAEELLSKEYQPVLIALLRDKRYGILQNLGERNILVYYYEAPTLPRNPLSVFHFAWKFFQAVGKVRNWVKKDNPRAIIGFGGYSCAPVLFAAGKEIPIFLCEQNSTPGRVNVFFMNKALKIFASFPLGGRTGKIKKNIKKVMVTGNPIRREAQAIGIPDNLRKFNSLRQKAFDRIYSASSIYIKEWKTHRKKIYALKTVLIFGGSQGARFLNDFAISLIKCRRDIKIILLAGKMNLKDISGQYKKLGDSEKVRFVYFDFIREMRNVYTLSDLVIARSGGSLFELANWNLPVIQVPFPFASDDHQRSNARFFNENFGYPISLQEDGLDALVQITCEFLSNESRIKEIKSRLKQKEFDNAGKIIVDELCHFI